LRRLRSLGFEVIPKLNFSAMHDAWLGVYERMISTPEYYKTCADVIKDVAEIFGRPRLFPIGMDEESDMGIQRRKDYIVKRQGSLYWHDVKFLEGEVNKHGARAWMFADESWFNRESFYANCPKSILLSNWYYGRSFRVAEAKWHPPRIKAYADLEAAGFDQVPCATNWYPDFLYAKKGIRANDVNFPLTVAHCRSAIKPERLKGFMMTTWKRTVKDCREFILHAIDLVGQSMLI
ncbi:MAG: Tat pathway signal protein, partial [Kiritimatiellae bacterium]|nr:Tat pathway signal protein [Kiritimatiellia bacterium]